MVREDWEAVYINQDRILNSLKELESDIFLAGGTGLHRFVLDRSYRHSEDLDFFFSSLRQNKEVKNVVQQMRECIASIPGATIEDIQYIKDERSFRFWCSFDDNNESIKIELLNFTCKRCGQEDLITQNVPFKTENLYNLLLYKLKALCDRPDTIKDLFDLYFIFGSLPALSIEQILFDLNAKFEEAIGIHYEKRHIIQSLNHELRWDIEIGEVKHLHDLQSEVEAFQKYLQEAFANEEQIDYSYSSRMKQRAAILNLDIPSYLKIIDHLEENIFFSEEIKRRFFINSTSP